MKFKYNSRDVDRSKDGDLTPPSPGLYRMKIESCTLEKEKNRLVFVARMAEADGEGNGKGYGFWDYVPLDLDWKVDNWLRAIGVDTEEEEEGDADTRMFVGKDIMARVVSDYYTPEGGEQQYRPRLRKPLPLTEDEDEEGWDEEADDADGEAEETPEAEEADEPTREDVAELGELGDDGDEEAMVTLGELGVAAGLDPDEYPTWGELAEAVIETMPKPKPAKKSTAKKTTATKKSTAKPKPEPEPAPDDDDYESWELEELREELEARELSSKGSKKALVTRLRKSDDEPF